MTFAAPGFLALLLVAGAAVGGLVVIGRRRRDAADSFARTEMRPWVMPVPGSTRGVIVGAGLVVVVVLLSVGAARPNRIVDVPIDVTAVIVTIDASRSMSATDIAPNRLDAAKAAARVFVRNLPAQLRAGYVTFSDSASVRVAPTADRDAVISAIDRTDVEQGTAIGEGIFKSLDAIATSFGLLPQQSDDNDYPRLSGSAIVILSDGKSESGRSPRSAARAAAAAGVPVSTIAFGTESGTLGGREAVPVDKDALREIADETRGRFFEATSEEELGAVYAEIETRVAYRSVQREISMWFVGAAVVVALLTALLSLAWFSRLA
jgi:Ca-activated chloride channel homolog